VADGRLLQSYFGTDGREAVAGTIFHMVAAQLGFACFSKFPKMFYAIATGV